MLVDEFENFRDLCLEMYASHSARFLTAPGLTWQAAFKNAKVKLDLLTDIKEVSEEEYITQFINMHKLITNT